MNRTDAPQKQAVPFALNGQREAILSETPPGDNRASYKDGFPPITMTLKSAGGLPPKGQDMNQILYELSGLARWTSAGALNTFDASFASAIGGYPSGSLLLGDDGLNVFVNTADGNTANPNSGGAGWVDLASYLKIREASSGIVGDSRNAKMNIINASVSATFSADEIIVEDSNSKQYRVTAFSKTINISTTGAGGMDTGTAPATGFVALYAIYNPTANSSAMLAVNSTSSIAPQIYGGSNMPSGYTASALVSVWPVSSSQLMPGIQTGRSIGMSDVTALNTTSAAPSLTSLSLSSIVPQNTKSVSGYGLVNGSTVASNNSFALAATSTGLGYKPFGANNSGIMGSFSDLKLYETQKIYYLITSTSAISGAAIHITEYTI
ncbi:phage tail protein [Cronobacter dublinensis]|uniref:phage tail protein n=1 Tax=Cronobacter dublinensis TaxID=413497 RepID=UPI001375F7F3|nr:phage tail protein [Cronobacter dublinensis]NCH06963.1 phage tail protein [Cronobacter dublinensis]